MIIETPFYTDAGMKYGYDLTQDVQQGWQARFGKATLHDDNFVDLATAIEAMLADAAQIALSTAIDICIETVQRAKTLEGALDGLRREIPPKPKGRE